MPLHQITRDPTTQEVLGSALSVLAHGGHPTRKDLAGAILEDDAPPRRLMEYVVDHYVLRSKKQPSIRKSGRSPSEELAIKAFYQQQLVSLAGAPEGRLRGEQSPLEAALKATGRKFEMTARNVQRLISSKSLKSL